VTWYGESYRLDWGTILAGADFDLTDWRLHFDTATHAVSTGDDVIIGAYADPDNFTAFATYDQPVVARWVLEVAGGSGTVHLSAGLDPDFNYDNPALATQDLGSFTVAGPTQIVSLPLEGVDHAMLAAQDVALIVRIEGTSGTVDVAQVKLRVWPSAGAGGAWVSGTDWVRTDADVDRWYASLDDSTPQLPTYADAWDALRTVVTTLNGRPNISYSNDPGGESVRSFFYVFDNVGTAPFTPSGSVGASIAVLAPRPGDPRPEPSINYGIDPNEVWSETRSYIRATGGGDAVSEFVTWAPEATLTVSNTHVGSVDLGPNTGLGPHPTNFLWRMGPFYHPSSFVLRDGAVPLSELGGQNLALAVMADGYYTVPSTDSFTFTGGSLSSYLPYQVRIANYEWFDPAAISKQPRFYVKNLDETMRPVGDGKPATELSVFRVPTAQGWFRDLTTAEYAIYGPDVRPPGGYPLKVKRLDSAGDVWWDQVGWMVPDV